MEANMSHQALALLDPQSEAEGYLRHYVLLALVGAFFSLTEETKLLSDVLAIPLLLGIIRSLHVGVLFREGFVCFRRLQQTGFYFESGLKGALAYPFVVSLIACLVFSALLMFVIPQFKDIFSGMRIDLPLSTRAILWLSEVMNDYWWMILPMVLGVPIFAIKSFSTRAGRETLTPWLASLPVLGRLYQELVLISFIKQWSDLLKEGLVMEEAFRQACTKAGSTADLQIIQTFIGTDQILENGLRNPKNQDLLPLLKTYEIARKKLVDRRVMIVEVCTILFMGAMVGGIVMSVFVPMGGLCNCACD